MLKNRRRGRHDEILDAIRFSRAQQGSRQVTVTAGEGVMGEIAQVSVPDIGDFTDVPIIEIQVKPGDRVKAEDPLITLESDKASMEVPSPAAGIVKTVAVRLGDKVSEGTPILTLEVDGSRAKTEPVKPAVSAPPAPTSAPAGVA